MIARCRVQQWLVATVILAGIACGATSSADDAWPQFRGADSRGTSSNDLLPDRWSATDNVAWKTDLPGRGWSSPVVWGDKIFLTTVVNLGESEEPKKGLYFGGNRLELPEDQHLWQVMCLDLDTGHLLWSRTVHDGQPRSTIHLKNSFASETPVVDADRLYACFGNVGIFCFSHSGDLLWQYDIVPLPTRYGWGTAASPVLDGGRLYYVYDNDEDSYLVALDAATGEQLWRVARDEKSNWATPYVWHNGQRTEIVTPGTGRVRSYDIDGNPLWELAGMSSITIAMPYEDNRLLYVSSGYVGDKSRPLYAIRPGAAGDISLAEGESSNDHIAWSYPDAAPYNPSTIVYEGLLYVLHDRGFLACYDAVSGELVYDRQRLPEGQAFTVSPWAYGGKIFCLNEDGVTYVVKAGREFEISHTNTLAEDDMCMATPALVGDRLLIRTAARLYCVRNLAASVSP